MTLQTAVLAFVTASLVCVAANSQSQGSSAAMRADGKLQHVEKNGELAHPDPSPTQFTEEEINAFFASGKVKLPVGVHSVIFRGQPGAVTASCNVDFDQVTAGKRSANPLLSLFSGVHEVVVTANAHGAGGRAVVEVQSVALDGVIVPRFILELFVEKFLQPKYPEVGLESRFPLPNKIESAVVGMHNLTLIQR